MSKKSLRQKRLEAARRQQQQRRLLYAVGGVLLVALLGYILWSQWPAAIHGLEETVGLARGHATDADLAAFGRPPVGGVHHPRWITCGVYREPVEVAMAVHSLEHGAVWLTYEPELPAEQVALLEEYARQHDAVLVSPYPTQESPIIASAWGAQVDIESVPDERIQLFIDRYMNQGPELGATCAGGVGDPVG